MLDEDLLAISSFFLRVGLASTFLYLGIAKAMQASQQAAWLQTLSNLPGQSVVWLNIILYAEIIIGLCLLIGVFTEYAASAGVALLLVNLFYLNWFLPEALMGPWGAYVMKDVAMLGAMIALAVKGAPRWSVDEIFRI